MTSTTKTSTIGNVCHAFSSTSTLVYTVLAMLFAKPGSTFFDADWIKHGFCVVNKGVPYWNSHDLCLYFDTVLGLVGLTVYYALRGSPRMKSADELMYFNLLGHFGHGVAHGFIARGYRNGTAAGERLGAKWNRLAEMEGFEIMLQFAVGWIFWFGLLKGVAPKVSNTTLLLSANLVIFGGLFVRDVLDFAYVQAVLTVVFASTQLTLPRDQKDFVYAAFAAISIPLSLIPWVESTSCQKFTPKLGGHLIYDVSIPLLLIAVYVASWRHFNSNSTSQKKKLT